MKPRPLNRWIEVFARGLAVTRSFSRPCIAAKIHDAWWLHDELDGRRRQRNDEWIAHSGIEPSRLDGWARERAAGRFLVSAVAADADEAARLRASFRALGYRLWRTEPLMMRTTAEVTDSEICAGVRLVETETIPSRHGKTTGDRKARLGAPGELSRARCLVAIIDDRVAGWARSITVGHASWCDSMFVEPEFRRRGIGRALVTAMLRADRAAGLGESILAARQAGAKLYSAVGYNAVGTVLVFNPPKG